VKKLICINFCKNTEFNLREEYEPLTEGISSRYGVCGYVVQNEQLDRIFRNEKGKRQVHKQLGSTVKKTTKCKFVY
jgi:hypothetical protein